MHFVPLGGSRRPIRGSHPLSKGFLYGFSSIEKHCSYIFILWFAALRRVSGGTYAGNLPPFKICVWRSLSDAFSCSVMKSMNLRIKRNGTAAISRLCRSFLFWDLYAELAYGAVQTARQRCEVRRGRCDFLHARRLFLYGGGSRLCFVVDCFRGIRDFFRRRRDAVDLLLQCFKGAEGCFGFEAQYKRTRQRG